MPGNNIPNVYFAKEVFKGSRLVIHIFPQYHKRYSAVEHVLRESLVFIPLKDGHEFRKTERIHADLVSSSGELSNDINGQEFGVTAGYKNVRIVFA